MVEFLSDQEDFEILLDLISEENVWIQFIMEETKGKVEQKNISLIREEVIQFLKSDELICIGIWEMSENGSGGVILLLWLPLNVEYGRRLRFEELFRKIGTNYNLKVEILEDRSRSLYFPRQMDSSGTLTKSTPKKPTSKRGATIPIEDSSPSPKNQKIALREDGEDLLNCSREKEDSCDFGKNEKLKENLIFSQKFEEKEILMTLKNLKDLEKRGQLLRTIERIKIDKYLKDISLLDFFDDLKSSRIILFRNMKQAHKAIDCEENYILVILNRTELTNDQKNHEVRIHEIEICDSDFEQTWNNAISLSYDDNFNSMSAVSELNVQRIPIVILKRSVLSVGNESTRQTSNFSDFEMVVAYNSMFSMIFSEEDMLLMRANSRIRNATRKNLQSMGYVSQNQSNLDMLLIFTLQRKQK